MNPQNVSLKSNYEYNEEEEEDYIEMELSSFDIEFEFQMSISSATFPADDLFHDGKLLPLHHLPRRPTAAAISPSESDDDNFFEWSNELNNFIHKNHPTKTTWIKKIKDSIFGAKIRAFSKVYLKTLFHSSSRDFRNVQDHKIEGGERRLFSSVIKGLSSSSSSSSSSNSSSFSVNYDEGSIEAAIAHCKKSQHVLNSTPDSIL